METNVRIVIIKAHLEDIFFYKKQNRYWVNQKFEEELRPCTPHAADVSEDIYNCVRVLS